MSSILNVLQHTPWWVFAVFALLTWLGAQALRPRDVPVWRLLIIAVSGASAGYFLGWLVRLALAYRRAAEPDLTEPVPVSAAAWRH